MNNSHYNWSVLHSAAFRFPYSRMNIELSVWCEVASATAFSVTPFVWQPAAWTSAQAFSLSKFIELTTQSTRIWPQAEAGAPWWNRNGRNLNHLAQRRSPFVCGGWSAISRHHCSRRGVSALSFHHQAVYCVTVLCIVSRHPCSQFDSISLLAFLPASPTFAATSMSVVANVALIALEALRILASCQ